jgi:ankyrin repeat protein
MEKVLQDIPTVIGIQHVALAIQHGHLDMARVLLSNDGVLAKLKAENDNVTHRMDVLVDVQRVQTSVVATHPMWETVHHGDLDLVKRVLEGLPVEFFRDHLAYREHHDHIAAGVPDEGTPLHLACALGHFDIVRFLLDRGANPAKQRPDALTTIAIHPTPLGLAIKKKHHDIVQHLMYAYPHLFLAPYSFCSALETGDESIAEPFFQAGVCVNAAGWGDKLVPLHSAIAGGNLVLVKRVLDLGAEVGPTSTAIGWVVFYGARENSVAMAKLLLERDAIRPPVPEARASTRQININRLTWGII